MTVQSYTYRDLGVALLDAAIDLYLSGNYLPALVLAGAAEEHLGGPHAKSDREWNDDPRAHKQDARDFNLVYQHLFGDEHPKPWDAVNEIKNRAKHYKADPFIIDAEDEAYWMIDRANKNLCLDTGNFHPLISQVDAAHRQRLQP